MRREECRLVGSGRDSVVYRLATGCRERDAESDGSISSLPRSDQLPEFVDSENPLPPLPCEGWDRTDALPPDDARDFVYTLLPSPWASIVMVEGGLLLLEKCGC